MGTQTIISVPSWAYSSVGQYINQAWNISQGYGNIPIVVVTSGYGANAQAVVYGGIIQSINVTNGGQWYSEAPTVTILANDSTGAGAIAKATVNAYAVTNIAVINGGTGYTAPPTILITPNGVGCSAVATVVGDKVDTVTMVDGGSNYTVSPYVEIVGGNGANATATAILTATGVDHIEVTNGGSGYATPPGVLFYTGNATATAHVGGGAVTSIDVTYAGNNMIVPPAIHFSGGGGSNAAAEAHLIGVPVYSITKANGGSGYATTPNSIGAYTGTTIAPQDADELAGIAALATRGTTPNTTIADAYAYADNIIKGGKLTGLGAGFLSKISTLELAAFAQISALIGDKSLNVGDPDTTLLAQTLVVDTPAIYVARLAAKMENDNYQSERASQDVSLGHGIDLGKQAAIDAEALRKAGLYIREYTQSTYELAHKLYIEQEEINVYKLEILGNALRAITGSQQQSTGPDNMPSSLMQAVGIASASVGIYNALSSMGLFASTAATATSIGIMDVAPAALEAAATLA